MKTEKAFIFLCIAAVAVGVLDLVYLVYTGVKVVMLLNGSSFLTPVFWEFSLSVSVINGGLVLFAVLYLTLRNRKQR